MATDAICKNFECSEKFKRKNSTKVYCNLTCKNRANYLINLKKNTRDILWNKGYEKNKKIIADLYAQNVLRVSHESLGYMGFNYLNLKEKQYKGELAYYIVGEFFLINDGEDYVRIQSINNKQ